MREKDNGPFSVQFTEEFNVCLDDIQTFFWEQGTDVLEWWFRKEFEIIDYIHNLLSCNPYAGIEVQRGPFYGLRRITYGKSRHRMLNYLIYYAVHESDRSIDVINILPSRSKRQRIK